MTYTKTVWKDLPDTTTPITASRLQNIEDGVEYLFENSEAGIEIKNEYSNLQNSVYSCNYVNNEIKKIYSADEKVVGKFFGKPLYSKTIINHPLTSGEQVFVDTGLQVSSIEHIFFDKSASFLIRSGGTVQCGIGTTSGYNFDTRYFSKTDGVNWLAGLYIGESIYQGSTVYVTICYTKTTD